MSAGLLESLHGLSFPISRRRCAPTKTGVHDDLRSEAFQPGIASTVGKKNAQLAARAPSVFDDTCSLV